MVISPQSKAGCELLTEDWDRFFKKRDKTEQERIWKKILQLKTDITARHLGFGVPVFVVEAGQYRIVFKEKETTRVIYFAGKHKDYEKWYKGFF